MKPRALLLGLAPLRVFGLAPDVALAVVAINAQKCEANGFIIADDGRGLVEMRSTILTRGATCPQDFPLLGEVLKAKGNVKSLKYAFTYGTYGTGGGMLEYYVMAEKGGGQSASEDLQQTFYFSNGAVLCNNDERTAVLGHRSDGTVLLLLAQPPRPEAKNIQGYEQLHAAVSAEDNGNGFCQEPDFSSVVRRLMASGPSTVATAGPRPLAGAHGVVRVAFEEGRSYWASSTCVGCQGDLLLRDIQHFPLPRFGELEDAIAMEHPLLGTESSPASSGDVGVSTTVTAEEKRQEAAASEGTEEAPIALEVGAGKGHDGHHGQHHHEAEGGEDGGSDVAIDAEYDTEVGPGIQASATSEPPYAAMMWQVPQLMTALFVAGGAASAAGAAAYVIVLRRSMFRDSVLPRCQDF